MPVTDLLRRNSREHGDEVALIELNPTMEDTRKISFKEFDLVQQTSPRPYRRQITWKVFDEKSNRVANMLLDRGITKGDGAPDIFNPNGSCTRAMIVTFLYRASK